MTGEAGRYSTSSSEKGFEVRAPDGRVILRCSDEATARHYVVMLNEAYSIGYKAGFREGLND